MYHLLSVSPTSFEDKEYLHTINIMYFWSPDIAAARSSGCGVHSLFSTSLQSFQGRCASNLDIRPTGRHQVVISTCIDDEWVTSIWTSKRVCVSVGDSKIQESCETQEKGEEMNKMHLERLCIERAKGTSLCRYASAFKIGTSDIYIVIYDPYEPRQCQV